MPPPIHAQPVFSLGDWWFCPSIYRRSTNQTNWETHLTSGALSPSQWVHWGNQIRHENVLLTVQKSKGKERRKKGRKQRKKTADDDSVSKQSIIQYLSQHRTNCMQKLFKELWTQCVSETLRHFPYRICRSKAVVFNHWWFCPPGDIRQFLGIFLVVTTKGVTGIQWVEVKKYC